LFFAISLLARGPVLPSSAGPSFSLSGNQVAVIDLEGIILDSKEFNQTLKDYGNAPGVKAVVLRINSPGGGVAASQEMFEAVRRPPRGHEKKGGCQAWPASRLPALLHRLRYTSLFFSLFLRGSCRLFCEGGRSHNVDPSRSSAYSQRKRKYQPSCSLNEVTLSIDCFSYKLYAEIVCR